MIVLVGLFFVSGADAASLVMGMLSSRGAHSPPRPVTIFWGVLTGASASVLLLAGGLEALQQASIIAAAPFVLVMIGLCVSLYRALKSEVVGVVTPTPAASPTPTVTQAQQPNGAIADVVAESTAG